MNEQTIHGTVPAVFDYALGFQPDAVLLLQRRARLWSELGRATFDDTLREGLDQLNRILREATPSGLALIIPDDQILYTDLALPAAATTEAALELALEGRTPYRVDELAWDFAPRSAQPGDQVRVAAVARQTLVEAEDFAVRHGFAPDRFIADPAAGQYPHTPDFGVTELAREWQSAADLTGPAAPDAALAPEVLAPAAAQADAVLAEPEPAAPQPMTAALTQAAPAWSRIIPHVPLVMDDVPAPALPAAATPMPAEAPAIPEAASVNLGSIVLPGEEPAEPASANETPAADPAANEAPPEVAAVPPATEEPTVSPPRREKPLPDRARAVLTRAREARKAKLAAAAATLPQSDDPAVVRKIPGKLPLAGILVIGLGIAGVLSTCERDPAPVETTSAPVAPQPETPVPVSAPPTQNPETVIEATPAVTVDPAAESVDAPLSPATPTAADPNSVEPAATEAGAPTEAEPVDGGEAPVGTAEVSGASTPATRTEPSDAASTPAPSATSTSSVAISTSEAPTDPAPTTGAEASAPSDQLAATSPSQPSANARENAAVSAAYADDSADPARSPAARSPDAPANQNRARTTQSRTTQPSAAGRPAAQAAPRPASPRQPAAASGETLRRSSRPASRPADLGASRAATERAETAAPASAAAPRPSTRPDERPPASPTAAPQPAPGAPPSATLTRSARPQSPPTRSAPAAQSAQPERPPAVPRSPQPYERRDQIEPSGTRPPARPRDLGALAPVASGRAFAFSQAGYATLLARLDQPFVATVASAGTSAPVRYAQARPAQRPTRSDAVAAAVAEAVATEPPPARPDSAAPAAPPPAQASAPSSGGLRLTRSARPVPRPAGLSASATPAASGAAGADSAAVEDAIAAAVASSVATPGETTLGGLKISARPVARGARKAAVDTSSAVAAALATPDAPDNSAPVSSPEGTLAPEPGSSSAEAEAAALAERRRLDDQLQAQAEQRIRDRAAADARAEAQAKAAAEARARAQAEAEAASARRKNEVYRPPEIDNEPEVAAGRSSAVSSTVTGRATVKGIDLNATQLIGTVGAGKASRGLVRLRNGRIVTVRLGDKINGGQIVKIGDGGLQYVKGGRTYSLPILNGR